MILTDCGIGLCPGVNIKAYKAKEIVRMRALNPFKELT
jgi:hypothetical protein